MDFHFPLSDRKFSGSDIQEGNDKSSYKICGDSVVVRKFVMESI